MRFFVLGPLEVTTDGDLERTEDRGGIGAFRGNWSPDGTWIVFDTNEIPHIRAGSISCTRMAPTVR
jgi:hypothetical protein